MIGLNKDSVVLSPYDKNWINEFKKEKKILEQVLKGFDIQIEHVGSTSVPNLSAKPIIDIALGTKDIQTIFEVAEKLSCFGYDMLNSFDEKGEILARKGPEENRTHYIHIELINGNYWTNHILFRDYLINHPNTVKEYEILKTELALQYADDRKKYTSAKNDFISDVLKKAKEEMR